MENAAAQSLEVAGEQAVDDVKAGPRGRWRDEIVDSTAARKPAELVVEEPDHDETEPENGDGTADERDQPHEVIGKTATRDGRPDARWDPHDDRDDESGQRELDRGGERVKKVVGDRAARSDASTEVAVHQTDDVGEVLLGQRPIEVILR